MPLPTAPFDPTKTIFAGLSVIQLKIGTELTGVNAATTVITKTALAPASGTLLQFVSGTGFTGLTAGTNYFVTNLSADTFSLSATSGGSAITVGTSSSGVFDPVQVYEAPMLDDDPEQSVKSLARPDAKGRLRNRRTVEITANEKWTFQLDEVKRLLEIFGGKMRGRKTGTCTLWIPDPDDVSGKVSLKSQTDFSVTVSRDGKVTFGNSDFSKSTIRIDSEQSDDVTWTADGNA